MDSTLTIRTDDHEYVLIDKNPRVVPSYLKSYTFYLDELSIYEISDIVDSESLRFFIDIDELNIPAKEKIYIQRYFRDFILDGIN